MLRFLPRIVPPAELSSAWNPRSRKTGETWGTPRRKEMIRSHLRGNVRLLVCAVFASTLPFGTGCRKSENPIVVRILLPPSASALREAVANFEYFPLETSTGRKIVPATMETTDNVGFQKFLKDVQVYRPQIVVVPTSNEIPAVLGGQSSYATLPCSSLPGTCVSVLTPWGTEEERLAARVVQRHIGPEERAGNH